MAEYWKQYKRALRIYEHTEDLRNHLLNHQETYGALGPSDLIRLEFLSKRLSRVRNDVTRWELLLSWFPYQGEVYSEVAGNEASFRIRLAHPSVMEFIRPMERLLDRIESLELLECELKSKKADSGNLSADDELRLVFCSARLERYIEEYEWWFQVLSRDPFCNACIVDYQPGEVFHDAIGDEAYNLRV
jgi:hypothetical protein